MSKQLAWHVQVQANIKAVLQQFAKIKPTVASGSINSASSDSNQESLTVKYLSSPRLLNLQLRDAGFRRHFIVQCLILLHACSRKSLNKQDTFKIKQVRLSTIMLTSCSQEETNCPCIHYAAVLPLSRSLLSL